MSIRITYPGASPSDIWSYSTRKLTERFVVIERARGFSSGFSKIYDETRFVNAILYLLGSGRGVIAIVPDDDIAYNKTWTVITAPKTGRAPTCLNDRDDSTYCVWSIPATTESDLVSIDFGSAVSGVFRFYHYESSFPSGSVHRIYGSNDGTTWTKLIEVSWITGREEWGYVSGYRYYKLSSYNAGASAYDVQFNMLEFYPDYALSYSKTFSNVSKRIVSFINNAYYQLLEVVTI